MSQTALAKLVDLERYPLLEEAGFSRIVQDARRQLEEASFARLPGFLRPGIADAMAAEVLEALPRAHRRERSFSIYDESTLARHAADHVAHRQFQNRQFVVATDVLPPSGLLRTLYGQDALTRRIAQMLGEPVLHPLADPVMACTATVMYEGDMHGWHFDLNDFVVSILLKAPQAGGTFDFAPNIRDDADENYGAVADVLDGRSQALRSVKVEAGTLLLFCGRRALHRVPPVIGSTPRIIALLSYDRAPGVRYGAATYERVVGRRHALES